MQQIRAKNIEAKREAAKAREAAERRRARKSVLGFNRGLRRALEKGIVEEKPTGSMMFSYSPRVSFLRSAGLKEHFSGMERIKIEWELSTERNLKAINVKVDGKPVEEKTQLWMQLDAEIVKSMDSFFVV